MFIQSIFYIKEIWNNRDGTPRARSSSIKDNFWIREVLNLNSTSTILRKVNIIIIVSTLKTFLLWIETSFPYPKFCFTYCRKKCYLIGVR
jgi:hypothetical protein